MRVLLGYLWSWSFVRPGWVFSGYQIKIFGWRPTNHMIGLGWVLIIVCKWWPERPRTGGWSLPSLRSDWLLVEYCRCRFQFDLCWYRWRAYAKGLSLAGHPRNAETSRLCSMDPVAEQDHVRAAWWQENQEVVDISRCRVAAHDWSLHVGFAAIHHKTVGLPCSATKTKTGGSAGGDGIQARQEASMPGDTRRDRMTCVGRTWTVAKAWLLDEECSLLDHLALEGCVYHFKF
jgi:hypothetical protein